MTASTNDTPSAPAAPMEVDSRLLEIFKEHNLTDFACNKIVFAEADPELSTPAEREFMSILQGES